MIVPFVLSAVFLALVAAAPGCPLRPISTADYADYAPLVGLSRALGFGSLSEEALSGLTLLGLLAFAATFVLALRQGWRGHVPLRSALRVAVALQLMTLALPLLVSRDVYSYSIYGRIVAVYHRNPYTAAPVDFQNDPLFQFIAGKWLKAPPVYGPVFTSIAALIAHVAPEPGQLVFAFKLLAVLGSLGTLAVLAHLVRGLDPARAAFAIMLFGWNPAVVVHSVASGHNDLLVALSIAGALALLGKNREYLATATLTLGALVKIAAGVPALLLVVGAVGRRPPGSRLRPAALHAAVALAITFLLAAPYFQLKDPTLGLIELASHKGWLSPSRYLAQAAIDLATQGGAPSVGQGIARVIAGVFPLAFLLSLLVIARKELRSGDAGPEGYGAAWGHSLLLLTLMGPVLLPWYIVWALPTGFALRTVPRRAAVALSALFGLSEAVAEPLHGAGLLGRLLDSTHLVVTLGSLVVLGFLLADLRASRAPSRPVVETGH